MPRSSSEKYNYHSTHYISNGDTLNMQIIIPNHKPEDEVWDVLFEIHGGGWVLGDENLLMIHNTFFNDPEARYVIFSPYYRLAPDYPFPHAPEDTYNALKWVRQNAKSYGANPDRIIISGTSAGGNLAAVTAIMARDDSDFNPKPIAQILHIPLVDFFLHSQSTVEFTHTPIWNTAASLNARYLYLPNVKDWADPRASPLHAKSHKNLSPAFIIVDQFDPFYNDGQSYYNKLRADGVRVEIYSFPAYHSGEILIYNLFGGYKKEITECKESLKSFLTGI